MKISRKTIKAVIGGLIFLLSSQAYASPADLEVKSINVPVYNLISDTLVGMSSTLSGKRNDFVMRLICDLARGDKNQQDINVALGNENISIDSIPKSGSMSSLLVNGNKADQAATCAAYIATTYFQPIDNTVLYDKIKDREGKDVTMLNLTQLNPARFAEEMKLRMSLTQATANFYAVIASNMPNDSNMSFADYQQSIAKTVFNYAPEYLRLVQVLFTSDRAAYTPISLSKTTMEVIDNQGRMLNIDSRGFIMKSRGVTWLGEGKILGKEYFVPVKIINTSAVKEKTEKTKEKKAKRTAKKPQQ